MPVQFVIGRAGSGRTTWCLNQIVRALKQSPLGPAIFWIVPRQATFSAERKLTCAAGLRGFCRARVVSFEMLGRLIMAECGGVAVPEVTALGRQIIISHLLRRHRDELRFFGGVAHHSGVAARLDELFGEIERAGHGLEDLQRLCVSADTGPIDNKLHDLRLLYAAYSAFLGQEWLDPHRRLLQVLDRINSCSLFRDAAVYVDGFLEFSAFERRVLAGLGSVCRSLDITLLMDPAELPADPHQLPDEMDLFHRTRETWRKLHLLFADEKLTVRPPVLLEQSHRLTDPNLRRLERYFAQNAGHEPRVSASGASSVVSLIEAPDRREEIDAVARQVRQWAGQGLRYREIGVLVRDLESYYELIEAAFGEHNIPCFIDRRRGVGHHPLLQFLRAIIRLAFDGWSHDAAMALLKSGLAGMDGDQSDRVENYALAHRIDGDAWAQTWSYRRTLTVGEEDAAERDEAAAIDALRHGVVDKLTPWLQTTRADSERPLRQLVLELFTTFERFQIRATLEKWMAQAESAGQFEQRDEHQQVWSELIELFDQMVELLGDEPVTPADFAEVLHAALERFDLALTPPTLDQVVVGQVDRSRETGWRAAAVMGLNEGWFPAVAGENCILSDRERCSLRERRFELEAETQRRLLDENLFGYIALTAASERLCLSRPLADDGGHPVNPSPFWLRVRELFPDIAVQIIPEANRRGPEAISTPRQLVTALMRWTRRGEDEAATDEHAAVWPVLYQWLATYPCCDDAIDIMRYRAWRALSEHNEARLLDAAAAKLFAQPLRASVSRLETFASCPFKHFLKYGLLLDEREEPQVTAIDLGNLYHRVLERFVGGVLRESGDWTKLDAGECEQRIGYYADEVGGQLRGELMLSNARNQYLLGRVKRTLNQVLRHQRLICERGKLRPAFVELSFGEDGRLPAFELTTPRGNRLLLAGRIDRVDKLESTPAFAVLDYKHRMLNLSLEHVYHKLNLQLVTYLLVLEENAAALFGGPHAPLGAFYVGLTRGFKAVDHPDDAPAPDDDQFHKPQRPRGIFDQTFLPHLDARMQPRETSAVVNAELTKDGAISRRNNDAVTQHDLRGVLDYTRRSLGELCDQISAGRIDIHPYRINNVTPCSHCSFHAVCRFDRSRDRYRYLDRLKREQALERIAQEAAHG